MAVEWKKLAYAEDVNNLSYTRSEKTDNYALSTDDLEKFLVMNASASKAFTLPNVDSSYEGRRVRCTSITDFGLIIYPYSGGSINGVSQISSSESYAFVELVVLSANAWLIDSVGFTTIKDSNYYGPWLLGS